MSGAEPPARGVVGSGIMGERLAGGNVGRGRTGGSRRGERDVRPPVSFASMRSRAGAPQAFSEFVATFGLLVVACAASEAAVVVPRHGVPDAGRERQGGRS